MSAKVEEVITLAHTLAEMAEALQLVVSQFRLLPEKVHSNEVQANNPARFKPVVTYPANDNCYLIQVLLSRRF